MNLKIIIFGLAIITQSAFAMENTEISREADTETFWALITQAQLQNKFNCESIINHQKKINKAVETALLCLYRIKSDPNEPARMRLIASELYRNFSKVLKPHLGNYIPVEKLLTRGVNIYDDWNNEWITRIPYEFLPIDSLLPNLYRNSEHKSLYVCATKCDYLITKCRKFAIEHPRITCFSGYIIFTSVWYFLKIVTSK